jgi:predicted nucleotide-binding protein
MTPPLLSRRDLALLARALGDNRLITHADIGLLWTGFVGGDVEMPDGNKQIRATSLVNHVASSFNADKELVELINEAYYFAPDANYRRLEDAFKPLLARLFEKNFTVDDDDGLLPPTGGQSGPVPAHPGPVASLPGSSDSAATKKSDLRTSLNPTKDSRTVFIVHGRNLTAKNELVKFLKHVDAKPISWEQAAAATGKPRPYTLDIIEAGMNMAQAIVVLFSPDDEARLKPHFLKPGDGVQESEVTGQARQNVTLEAGMAMALAPDNTVFVRIGHPRDISDILGINWIDLDDTWASRKRLVSALDAANVKVETDGELTAPNAGTFSGIQL